MGNSEDWVTVDNSFRSQHDLLASLIPIDEGENSNEMLTIGKFTIYRFKAEPYELIMKHVRTFALDNPRCEEYSRMARAVASRIHHKNVAKIHCINICSKSSICSKEAVIESYANYYAINLQQMIDQRKANDSRFTSGEIWYIVKSLIELSFYLKKKQVYFGVYLPRNIYLSHEGYLKIYLYHLHPNNNHLLYYHMIRSSNRDMHRYLPMPPECLPFLRLKMQELKHINMQKLDVFGIAMIALEAMLFSSTRKYYSNSQNNFSFDENLLANDLNELKEVYSLQLIDLLQKMVMVNPNQRISLEQARNFINLIRDNTPMNGAIKMIQDDDNLPGNKISYRISKKSDGYDNILKSITHDRFNGQSKLQFVPLRQISRQKRNKKQSQHLNVTQFGLHTQLCKKKKKLSLSKDKQEKKDPQKGIRCLKHKIVVAIR